MWTLLHPKLVHFPIALIISAALLNIASFVFKKESLSEAAWHIFVLSGFFAILAVVSGLWEADRLHLKHPILYAHRNWALAVLVTSWLSLGAVFYLRRAHAPQASLFFMVITWVLALAVVRAGYFGGEMVYQYGIGVSN